MGPLQFIFVACLSADPETCREVYGPIFGQPIAQSTCMLEGPAITAAWGDAISRLGHSDRSPTTTSSASRTGKS
jgi:hypothetical protein